MSHTASTATWRALGLALALYLVWVLATWFLEGRVLTFQRPEDVGARLIYALVANVLIGIGGSALAIVTFQVEFALGAPLGRAA